MKKGGGDRLQYSKIVDFIRKDLVFIILDRINSIYTIIILILSLPFIKILFPSNILTIPLYTLPIIFIVILLLWRFICFVNPKKEFLPKKTEDFIKKQLALHFGYKVDLYIRKIEIQKDGDYHNETLIFNIKAIRELSEYLYIVGSEYDLGKFYMKDENNLDENKIFLKPPTSNKIRLEKIRGKKGEWAIPIVFDDKIKQGRSVNITLCRKLPKETFASNTHEANIINSNNNLFNEPFPKDCDYTGIIPISLCEKIILEVILPKDTQIAKCPLLTEFYSVSLKDKTPKEHIQIPGVDLEEDSTAGSKTDNLLRLTIKQPELLFKYYLVWRFLT